MFCRFIITGNITRLTHTQALFIDEQNNQGGNKYTGISQPSICVILVGDNKHVTEKIPCENYVVNNLQDTNDKENNVPNDNSTTRLTYAEAVMKNSGTRGKRPSALSQNNIFVTTSKKHK